MQSVAVVVQDSALRETLEDLLRGEGYEVLSTSDFDLAHMMLRAVQRPLVVIFYYSTAEPTHKEIDAFFHSIDSLPPHAYIVLIPAPRQVPASSRNLNARPIVITHPIPFDLDSLLREIEEAESRLNESERQNGPDEQSTG